MDRLGPRLTAGGDDLVGDKVGLRRRRRADEDGLVRHLDGHGIRVGLGIDHDGGDPHPAAGLNDADRNLAAVGDQNL